MLIMQPPENSLSDIALACGFADQSHFTCVFGRIVGSSPKAMAGLHEDLTSLAGRRHVA